MNSKVSEIRRPKGRARRAVEQVPHVGAALRPSVIGEQAQAAAESSLERHLQGVVDAVRVRGDITAPAPEVGEWNVGLRIHVGRQNDAVQISPGIRLEMARRVSHVSQLEGLAGRELELKAEVPLLRSGRFEFGLHPFKGKARRINKNRAERHRH